MLFALTDDNADMGSMALVYVTLQKWHITFNSHWLYYGNEP